MMVDMVIPDYEETPPPIVRTQYSVEQEAEWAAQARFSDECQHVCAVALVYSAAHQTRDMDVSEAWHVLGTMPRTAMDFLYSPDGWATLIDGLRLGLALDGPPARVSVH